MVIIHSRSDDLCGRFTEQALWRLGAEVLFIDRESLFPALGVSWEVGQRVEDSLLVSDGEQVSLSDLTGALLRWPAGVGGVPRAVQPEALYIEAEQRAAMAACWHAFSGCVINRPSLGQTPRWPFTSATAARQVDALGFRLPDQVMTSEVRSALQFYRGAGRRALLGSPTGRRMWRLLLGDAGEQELQAAACESPVRLLAAPEGEWLQVFTVGDRAFGTAAPLDRLTEAGEPLGAAAVSPALAEACCGLARSMRLEFAHIHLLRTGCGRLYCLDLVTMPEINGCEVALQTEIAVALAERLAGDEGAWTDGSTLRSAGRSGDRLSLLAPGGPVD
jgi:hypothetical protein